MNIIWILLLWILCDVGKTETNEEDVEEMEDVVTAEVHLDGTSMSVSEWSANLREASLEIMRAGDERFAARREETRRLGGMDVYVRDAERDSPVAVTVKGDATVADLANALPPHFKQTTFSLSFKQQDLVDEEALLSDLGISSDSIVEWKAVNRQYTFQVGQSFRYVSGDHGGVQVWKNVRDPRAQIKTKFVGKGTPIPGKQKVFRTWYRVTGIGGMFPSRYLETAEKENQILSAGAIVGRVRKNIDANQGLQ